MSKFTERYVTDRTLEEDGMWVDLGDDLEIKIRRIKSKASLKVKRRLEKPYERMMRAGRDMPGALRDDLTAAWVAEGVLVDWRGDGRPDRDGELLDYSAANALYAFKQAPDFLDDVVSLSSEAETFRAERLEEQAKNSPAPSDSTSSSAPISQN